MPSVSDMYCRNRRCGYYRWIDKLSAREKEMLNATTPCCNLKPEASPTRTLNLQQSKSPRPEALNVKPFSIEISSGCITLKPKPLNSKS